MPAPTPIIILIKAGAASYEPPCRSVGDAAASLSIIRGPGLRLIGLGVVCMWVWVFNATGDDRETQVAVYQLAVELDLTWLWTAVDVDLKWLWSSSGCGYLMS